MFFAERSGACVIVFSDDASPSWGLNAAGDGDAVADHSRPLAARGHRPRVRVGEPGAPEDAVGSRPDGPPYDRVGEAATGRPGPVDS